MDEDLSDDDAPLEAVVAGGSFVDILRGQLDDSRFGAALHKVFQASAGVREEVLGELPANKRRLDISDGQCCA